MAKDISKVIIKIEDDAGWTNVLELSENKVVVVDVHQEWCGPCDAILPTFQRVFLDYDNADERICIAEASIQALGNKIQTYIPKDTNLNLSKHGCLPIFIVLRHFLKFKTCVTAIVGVDAPAILQQIVMNIPENKQKDDDR